MTQANNLIAAALADPAVAWSLGSFGAIAEFMWSPLEDCVDDGGSRNGGFEDAVASARVTPRGAISVVLPPGVEVVPYTTPSRDPARRRHATALCLTLDCCFMAGRTVVTELGPDMAAARAEHRDAVLFDVGLGLLQVDAMVRSADPETLDLLRAAEGRPLFAAGMLLQALPRLSPHRVFASRCGRIEVFGPIPPPDGLSPDGPHTHVLPKLLAHKRTHAANLPIPDGLVPCLTLHPMRPDPGHALDDSADEIG